MIFAKFSAGFWGVMVFQLVGLVFCSVRFSRKMLWWCCRMWKLRIASGIGVSENTPERM